MEMNVFITSMQSDMASFLKPFFYNHSCMKYVSKSPVFFSQKAIYILLGQ